jgi:hypothetical protein
VADWFWQKVDVFIAAVFVAVAGIAACQGHEVMVQYIERLASETDQARLHLLDTQSGLRYRVMGDTVRAEHQANAKSRFDKLKRALDTVTRAPAAIRPLAMVKDHDAPTLAKTRAEFQPAMPTTIGGAVYALVGALVGFVIYEIVKLPVLMVREPKRRRFRRRG